MLLKFFKIFIVVLIALSAAIFYFQSSKTRVLKTVLVPGPVEEVFAQVNDLHNWESWSPWSDLDPDMTKTYTGPAFGTGSVYQWRGNNKAGEGRVTITESLPNERIRMKVLFLKPFMSNNDVEFTFEPQGSRTAVTWKMEDKNNFISKAAGMIRAQLKIFSAETKKKLAFAVSD